MARPMPVLPLVASITVWPGLSWPARSAASITPSARRSLTEPSGLNASILTNRLTSRGASLLMRTTGVWPTVSRMLWYLLMRGSAGDAIVASGLMSFIRLSLAWSKRCPNDVMAEAAIGEGIAVPATTRARRSGALLLARVVLGIDVGHVERTDPVDLDHRLLFGPGIVRHAGRQVNEARGRQGLERFLLHLLTRPDGETSGNDGDQFVLRVAMRRDREAGRKFQPQHERPFLGRAAQQHGGLGARRQRRRRRSPLHGVGRHDGVMLLGGLQRRSAGDKNGGQCQPGQRNDGKRT